MRQLSTLIIYNLPRDLHKPRMIWAPSTSHLPLTPLSLSFISSADLLLPCSFLPCSFLPFLMLSSPFRHLAQQTHVTESLLLVLSSQQPLLYTAATSNLLLDLQNQLTLLSFFSLSPSRNQCPSFLCFYWPQNVFVLYIPFSANSKN